MEEGSELIQRLTDKTGKSKIPMFTSCCPGWVRFLKLEYPELVPNLSSAKSPQQMFGAVAKTYFAEKKGIDPKNVFCVSVMPCTAKKYESAVPEVNSADAGKDVDVVITTREIDRMLRASHINCAVLEEEEFDSPLGTGTGAAVIFGATGGVMEAALRSAYFLITGKNPDAEAFSFVRGTEGVRDGTLDINGLKVKVAATSGLANARRLIEDIKAGKAHYDFVEIMACPGGCAGGGGQPIREGCELAGVRGERLYSLDKASDIRFSHENPDVIELYKSFLEKPLSHKSHDLLHTNQWFWSIK
jgi:NADH-quinone oxidoreductase subunit G